MRILAVVWKTFGSFACDPFCSENKWRGTPGDKADVPATKLPLTYLFLTSLVPAPELSLSDAKNDPCRKMRDTLYREQQLWSGNQDCQKSVRERQLCIRNVGFVTWRSSSFFFLSKMDHKRKTRMFSKLNHAAWSEISTRCRRDRSPQLICH